MAGNRSHHKQRLNIQGDAVSGLGEFAPNGTRGRGCPLGLLLLGLTLLGPAGCGGGGGSSSPRETAAPAPQTPPPDSFNSFNQGVFEPASNFKNLCAAPRLGEQFPDTQGSSADENHWLRSWSNELYLWYDEIADQNPANFTTPTYFDLMKTMATTPAGTPKDQFHFTIPTDQWEALAQSGQAAGYGTRFSVIAAAPPREIVIAYTDSRGPASAAGLFRGARVLQVDGISVANGADVDTLNAGLFPTAGGEDHEFVVADLNAVSSRTITLRSAIVTDETVRNVEVIDTPSGPVGYLLFTQHLAPSEQKLIDAFTVLGAAEVTDLVVDLRYNGGGFLDIANELAYMIAGASAAAGRVFSELQFNDKHTSFNPVTGQGLGPDFFHSTTQGFSAPAGDPLPTLDLNRVFLLTGAGTCSASEAIINGLNGIDFEVIQIGTRTCGKPYGFYAADNCATTYFSIQFRGVNAKGFGDYPDGFSPQSSGRSGAATLPGCLVDDDYNNPLGNINEGRLAAALDYRQGLGCPATATSIATTSPTLLHKAGAAGALTTRRIPGSVKME
jgi:carboxyl-terminal processing protease